MLRRLKADVLQYLPKKKEMLIHVSLTETQRNLYKDILIMVHNYINLYFTNEIYTNFMLQIW